MVADDMFFTLKTSGFRELEKSLDEISKQATRKNTAIRALEKGAEPMRARISALAPVDDADLQRSVAIAPRIGFGGRGTTGRRTKTRRGGSGGEFGDEVEIFIGIDLEAKKTANQAHPLAYAEVTEFGSTLFDVKQKALPFFRPGFDAEKHNAIGHIADALRVEIGRAIERQSRKAARSGGVR